MKQAELKGDNHYVPHSYLKRWGDNNGNVWGYRVLVPHPNARHWIPYSAKGLAYHRHLYTRVIASGESDDIERWFDEQFESPAGKPTERAVSDEQLTTDDWRALVRFLAAQDARTPARLIERMKYWRETMPSFLNETLAESVQELEAARRAGLPRPKANRNQGDAFPLHVSIQALPEGGGEIKAGAIIGRSLWLFTLKHLLTNTINALLQHRWTILRSPAGMEWLTSDDPVIRLNYQNAANYSFGGGWGSKGTEIFMPLSPTHLMYTKIGWKPPARGHVLSWELASAIQRFTVEHAHRFVISRSENSNVASWRPRTVDKGAFVREREEWERWHADQSKAERELVKHRAAVEGASTPTQ